MWKKRNTCTVIVGCGRLGASLAGKLSDENKDVIIIDCDKTSFRKLPYSYGGLTLTASATDIDKLTLEGIGNASVFIAVTNQDCINICAAQIAKNIFNIPKVVVRIYDTDKKELINGMGIDMICPSELSEKEIANYLEIGVKKNVRL